MKKTLRILSLAMLLVLLTISFAGCHKKIDENLPSDMQDCARGERKEFNMVKMKSYACTPTISGIDTTTMIIKVEVKGYAGIDYYNCRFDFDLVCDVLYDDMTEVHIEKVIEVVLPYDGNVKFDIEVPLGKQAHDIYNNTFKVSNIEGQAIKKY
jgi:hypothetical protein